MRSYFVIHISKPGTPPVVGRLENMKFALNSTTRDTIPIMKIARDIQSLSVFKRDTAKFRRQLKRTKQPIVLTVNGKADMVVIDADSYDEYMREQDRLGLIASVNRGIDDMRAGRTKPAEKVFREFEKKYKHLLGE